MQQEACHQGQTLLDQLGLHAQVLMLPLPPPPQKQQWCVLVWLAAAAATTAASIRTWQSQLHL
jgi:hypothetical protein